MLKEIKNFITDIADFFFPSHCMCCNKAVEKGNIICKDCFKGLERLPKSICKKCGLMKSRCDCKNHVYHFSAITAPFYNKGVAQQGLYKMKFGGCKPASEFYGHCMADSVIKNLANKKFDAITYVPMNAYKGFTRGYNQSQWLAEQIAKELGLPIFDGVLKRKLISFTQHRRGGIERRFFNAYKSYYRKGTIPYKTVLLVDDIKTTAASLDACARQLLYAGALEVCCVTALVSDKEKNS